MQILLFIFAVAPFAEAWIETATEDDGTDTNNSRLLRGGVDKNKRVFILILNQNGRMV